MRPATRTSLTLAALLTALMVGGCGLGAGPGTRNASIEVTGNFGSTVYGSATERRVPGSETVMSMLQRHFKVSTRYGGGFVQSIDGHAGSSARRDWFYYVNGILAPSGAASTSVNHGDHIWWDLHDWSLTQSVPAVVGSYPEPFTNGIGGKQLPTVLDCATNVRRACNIVARALRRAGVKVGYQLLGAGSGSQSLALVVGTWKEIQGVIAAELVAGGPTKSGIYAQFAGGGGLALFNPAGRVVRTLHGSVGLVAATEEASINQPTWLVTGSDVSGVTAAAAALTPAKLHNHFAVAVQGTRLLALPLQPGS